MSKKTHIYLWIIVAFMGLILFQAVAGACERASNGTISPVSKSAATARTTVYPTASLTVIPTVTFSQRITETPMPILEILQGTPMGFITPIPTSTSIPARKPEMTKLVDATLQATKNAYGHIHFKCLSHNLTNRDDYWQGACTGEGIHPEGAVHIVLVGISIELIRGVMDVETDIYSLMYYKGDDLGVMIHCKISPTLESLDLSFDRDCDTETLSISDGIRQIALEAIIWDLTGE